ncbi:MAG TPA: hypothetical protein VLH83_11880, partial [Chthoniobacterales bacterium]|nr:hypothetical protein [Chthoniobacterales bacterium]
SSVAIDIGAIAGFNFDLHAGVDDVQVVEQSKSRQGRVIYFYAGIDDRDAYAFAGAFLQSTSCFVQAEGTGIRR